MITRKILILEVNLKNYDVLKKIFEQDGFVCSSVLSMEDFKQVDFSSLELVLVNSHISYIDAQSLIKLINKDNIVHVPVVYLDNSKEYNKKLLHECFMHGICEYIKKPFDKQEILVRIKYHHSQFLKMGEYKLRVEKLGHLATVDQLSKSSSKMHMQAILKHQVENFRRYKTPTTIVYLSLLNINKNSLVFGFEYGEKAISLFSKELKHLIRESDVLARWGGADFMILLSNTEIKAAGLVVQKLKSKLSNVEFMKDVKPELAFGITSFVESDTLSDVVQRVKYAYSEAKKQQYGKVFIS